LTHLAHGAVDVRSAGSEPADRVNPAAVAAMAEVGIDIAAEQPKILTNDAVKASDVVITMGCGRIKIELKDDMRKRGLPSPDRADTAAMLFSGRAQGRPVDVESHAGESITGDLMTKAW
jgi:protein-tyrosine-phosphatase